MAARQRISKTKIVIVEGDDECKFFNALFSRIGVTEIQVLNAEGKGNFPGFFDAFWATEGIESVVAYALVRDADDSETSALSSLQSMLRKHSQPIPATNMTFATNSGSPIKAGVCVLPGGARNGMLEDLCLDSVSSVRMYGCVDAYFACIAEHNTTTGAPHNLIGPKNHAKARVMAYLSAKPDFVPRVGIAAEKNYFDLDHNCFDSLKAFLRQM